VLPARTALPRSTDERLGAVKEPRLVLLELDERLGAL
jgi:hypothetical protein